MPSSVPVKDYKSKFHTAPEWQAWLVALGIGLVVFIVGVLIDWWLIADRRNLLYSDAYTGFVAAVLSYVTIRYYYARQREAARQMQMIAEVNHHVRNALSVITLSVHVRQDPELSAITQSAVERIDWVLREVLPADGAPESDRSPDTTTSR